MTAVTRVFLDACVFVAAAGSRTGGSALVLELSQRRLVRTLATQRILLEAERNIRGKMGVEALGQFYHDIGNAHLRVVSPPSQAALQSVEGLIDPKDAHVLASAIASRVTILLTLDRKHFMTPALRNADLGFSIQTPGDFLRAWSAGE
ncbi:MAG: PIN domain-containing protein [Nitrospirota bacterium]